MSRPLIALGVALAAAGLPCPAAAQEKGPNPEKNSYLSSPSVIAAGISLLKDKNLSVNANIDFRPHFQAIFAPKVSLLELNLGRSRELDRIDQQLKRETNDLIRQQLEVQRKQLEVQIEQAKIAEEQARILGQIRDQSVVAFQYQKRRDDSLLRRLDYTFRPGKLVVVVADFSSGGSSEGVEIADEIANALAELRSKFGIDFEILVGEVKPGVVIRSEQMAFDVGQHFPKGTGYAVVWGTLSPRTAGKFRPHVTCAVKADEASGVSQSYTIDPDSQPLPLASTDEAQRRERHNQLIAFACAVVPGCYASHELVQDRKPNLDKYLKFLDGGGDETKKIADRYRAEIAHLSQWVNVSLYPGEGRPRYDHLRRVTPVTKDTPFPRAVLNNKDGSLMTLVTEPGTDRARRFRDAGGEYIVYIDVTETTNRQLVSFLNENGNRKDGGAWWVEVAPGTHIREADDRERPGKKVYALGDEREDAERPAVNVSYIGAEAYCRWAHKSLPRTEEWQAAARPAGAGKYPWGEEVGSLKDRCANAHSRREPFPTHRVGSFKADTSHVGCLDMAGNVSEWCEEFSPGPQTDRIISGGNVGDSDAACFEVTRQGHVPQVTHHNWLGFRGVVRIRVPAEKN